MILSRKMSCCRRDNIDKYFCFGWMQSVYVLTSLLDNSSQDDLLLQSERAVKILYENDRDSEYFFITDVAVTLQFWRHCSDVE